MAYFDMYVYLFFVFNLLQLSWLKINKINLEIKSSEIENRALIYIVIKFSRETIRKKARLFKFLTF